MTPAAVQTTVTSASRRRASGGRCRTDTTHPAQVGRWKRTAPGGLIADGPVVTGTFDRRVRLIQRVRRPTEMSGSTGARRVRRRWRSWRGRRSDWRLRRRLAGLKCCWCSANSTAAARRRWGGSSSSYCSGAATSRWRASGNLIATTAATGQLSRSAADVVHDRRYRWRSAAAAAAAAPFCRSGQPGSAAAHQQRCGSRWITLRHARSPAVHNTTRVANHVLYTISLLIKL